MGNEGRLAGVMVKEMSRLGYDDCWMGDLRKIGEKYRLGLEEANKMLKSQWKKTVKKGIDLSMEEEFEICKREMIKLRFLDRKNGDKIRNYLDKLESGMARDIMKIRLNMWKIGCNL